MSADQILLCLLLGIVMVMLISEWIPLEVTALLTMGTLALTGLVSPQQALAGFSSPAVVTIWAVFILSGGLDRTGVADHIGHLIQRCAGRSEIGLITTLMLGAGIMSAFMNNIAVVALMLPVTMDLARRYRVPPSRLMLPLAFGALLGGLTTVIGTTPNILVSSFLLAEGLTPFGLFDFTPIGGLILLAGTAYMVLVGRLLLPQRDVASAAVPEPSDLTNQYELQERTFALVIPSGSPLAGLTLADSRLGSAVGLHVIAISRQKQLTVAPHPSITLAAGDRLYVQGRLERICDIQALANLISRESQFDPVDLRQSGLTLFELQLPEGSPLVGQPAAGLDEALPEVELLALRRDDTVIYEGFADLTLRTEDALLVLAAEALAADTPASLVRIAELEMEQLESRYQLANHLVRLELVSDPDLAEISMDMSRIEAILGLRALLVIDTEGRVSPHQAATAVSTGSQILALETSGSMQIILGLASLQVDETVKPTDLLGTGHVDLAEAVLAPRSALAGKTLRQLQFRERYGISVLAIWRAGRAYRSNLRDMPLEFGDALLLLGTIERIRGLGDNPDIIVLSRSAQQAPRSAKALHAALVMAATLLPVLLGLVPIHLAAIFGAAGMVLSRCLTMEEAYRSIEWRAVFLIAGLLPLGVALEQSGLAGIIARLIVELTGGHHPVVLLGGLVLLTFVAACIVPTAVMVLLMAPIALHAATAVQLAPHALLMAISMAASASFLTPISHPANIMVMGPGGYRVRDYFIIGLPLTLIVFIIIVWLVPLFWPLTA